MGGKRATIRIASRRRSVMIIAAKIVVRKRTDLEIFYIFLEAAVNGCQEIFILEGDVREVGTKENKSPRYYDQPAA